MINESRGYFPLHEDIQRLYKPHPFHYGPKSNNPPSTSPPKPETSPSIPSLTSLADVPMLPPLASSTRVSPPIQRYHPSIYYGKNKYKNSDNTTCLPISNSPSLPYQNQQESDIEEEQGLSRRDMIRAAATAEHLDIPKQTSLSPSLLPLEISRPVSPMELEETVGYFRGDEERVAIMIREDEMLSITGM